MDRFRVILRRFHELTDQQVQPVGKTEDDVLATPLSVIKEKYKARYELYRKLFLHERKVARGRESDLSAEEIGDMRHYVSFLNSLDVRVRALKSNEDAKIHPLRLKMVEGVLSGMEQGHRTGYISAPTQSGKTWAMTEILRTSPGKKIILCDSQELVKQTSLRLSDFGIENSVYYGKVKESLEKDGIVTTYDSFRNLLKRGKENGGLNKDEIDLLILDEGHEALGKQTREQVNEIKELGTNIIGLSATPEYHEGKSLMGLLGHCYCDISIKEAGEEGLIANFKSIFAFTETDLSDVAFKSGEYDEAEYLHAIKNEKRTRSIWELYDKYLKTDENGREQKGLVFGNRIEYIEHMYDFFKKAGVPCAVITGSTGDSERTELINEWKRGNIKILFGVQAIAQGISFDGGDFIVCADGTFSKVKQGQRCGRSLGVVPNNPDRVVKIVEIIDRDSKRNIYPITFPQIAKVTELVKVKVRQDREKAPEEEFIDEDLAKLLKTQTEAVPPQIEGLKITIDPKEIMSVVSRQERNYDLAMGRLLEPEKLLEELKKYPEINGPRSYEDFVQNPENKDKILGWPMAIGSYVIQRKLGTVNEWMTGERGKGVETVPAEDLLKLIKETYPQITGRASYDNFIKHNPVLTKSWPSRTTIKKHTGLNIGEWIKGRRIDLTDLKRVIIESHPEIKGVTSYIKFQRNNPGITKTWPSYQTIQSQTGLTFNEWLTGKKGVEVEIDLENFLSELKTKYPGITGTTSYNKHREENPEVTQNWPSYNTIQSRTGLTFSEWLTGKRGDDYGLLNPYDLLVKIKTQHPGIDTVTKYLEFKEQNPQLTSEWPSYQTIQNKVGMTFNQFLKSSPEEVQSILNQKSS